MLKVEAKTLEEAYQEASSKLECSITQLNFEIIQHPKTGFLGMFRKTAIIVATCKKKSTVPQETVSKQKRAAPKPKPKADTKKATATQKTTRETPQKPKNEHKYSFEDSGILDSFYDNEDGGEEVFDSETIIKEIDSKLQNLFSTICFDLDNIEVSMLDQNTVYINIQGNDAALLIGKEGYRYKAISYMLFNWINAKYSLATRLEIAQFLTSQEKMIANYIKPVINQIEQTGKGSTKPLDGILVQIALKQLRNRFPNKYVGIKSNSFDEKYIIVNDFKK
ncbi:MAG: Jag N-terminal domain-containing protein [Campylobacterota bacterium]